MKTILRKTAIATALFLSFAASAFTVNAQNDKPVYDRNLNRSIGVTVESAAGANYQIRDIKGNVILQGTIRDNKTFFIPTARLGKGTYRFFIGSLILQEFVIK